MGGAFYRRGKNMGNVVAFWFDPTNRYIIEWDRGTDFNVYQMVNTNLKWKDSFSVADVKTIDQAFKQAEQWIRKEHGK